MIDLDTRFPLFVPPVVLHLVTLDNAAPVMSLEPKLMLFKYPPTDRPPGVGWVYHLKLKAAKELWCRHVSRSRSSHSIPQRNQN
jgi:hypothetical protein